MFEIRAVEATVAGEKAVGLARGVGADQEVGCHSRPGASSLAICLPSDAGFEGGLRLERTELQAQPVEGFLGCRNRREQTGDLRPHYLARDERAFSKGGAEGIGGNGAKDWIGSEHIEQDVAVYSGDHSGFSPPRSSPMISSVERPSLRIPYSSSIASRGGSCFVITKRPRSSHTSSTWPVRMPRRTRKGLGIVICPFSETTVFIPASYEFLPGLSSARSGKRVKGQALRAKQRLRPR